jgi:hypothetical protein
MLYCFEYNEYRRGIMIETIRELVNIELLLAISVVVINIYSMVSNTAENKRRTDFEIIRECFRSFDINIFLGINGRRRNSNSQLSVMRYALEMIKKYRGDKRDLIPYYVTVKGQVTYERNDGTIILGYNPIMFGYNQYPDQLSQDMTQAKLEREEKDYQECDESNHIFNKMLYVIENIDDEIYNSYGEIRRKKLKKLIDKSECVDGGSVYDEIIKRLMDLRIYTKG